MFQHYSRRALQIIFATRVKAGLRGADSLDVGDLLFAFVTEDQSMFRELMSQLLSADGVLSGVEAHPSFLPPEIASRVLETLESELPSSTPVPMAQDLPLTFALQAVLERAEALRSELGHNELRPLHLFAAFLQKSPPTHTRDLEKDGITYESVLRVLHAES